MITSVILQLARHKARRAVEAEIKSRGIRPIYVPIIEIRTRANAYFDAHREELIEQTTEMVMRCKDLRKMHERELKQRAKLASDAQKKTQPISTTSSVQNSGSEWMDK
jgi:GTPase